MKGLFPKGFRGSLQEKVVVVSCPFPDGPSVSMVLVYFEESGGVQDRADRVLEDSVFDFFFFVLCLLGLRGRRQVRISRR